MNTTADPAANTADPAVAETVVAAPDVTDEDDKIGLAALNESYGGRRHKGGKKTRKVNPALKSWVAFVKKVQHEEKITYPKAMKRASIRKSELKRGGMLQATPPMAGGMTTQPLSPASVTAGGSRRRRTKRHGSKKRRGTKRRR